MRWVCVCALVAGLGACTARAPTETSPPGLPAKAGRASPPAAVSGSTAEPRSPTELSSLPACTPVQYRLSVSAGGENTGLAVALTPRYLQGDACKLSGLVTLTLLDPSGRRLAVAGNPTAARVAGEVGAGVDETEQFPNLFYWTNWCGSTAPTPHMRLAVTGGPGAVQAVPSYLPSCLNRAQPSRLAVIANN
jgi:hypothetical protein